MYVLGSRTGERGTTVTSQLPRASGVQTTRQQRAFLIQSLLVNLAGDSIANLLGEEKPICPEPLVREPLPQRLAETQQQLHGEVMVWGLSGADRDFYSRAGFGPA